MITTQQVKDARQALATHRKTVTVDCILDGYDHYGRITALRKRQGALEGKLLSHGCWVEITAIHIA